METLETLTLDIRDGIALVTLNRPEARNALSIEMREDLNTVVMRLRRDLDLKALVIIGSGGSFCAGGDLKGLKSADTANQLASRQRFKDLHIWFQELVNLEVPVIAAVDGPAFGAGFNLALAADFILATPRAKFSAVFGRVGLVPDLGGFFLLPRIVGLQRAKDLVFTARSIDVNEARDLGIVHEIHPEDVLLERAMAFAARFREASREAIGMAKIVLNQSFHSDQRAMADLEAFAQAMALSSDYHKQAVASFVDKQPLRFNWDQMTRDEKA